ncbi:hypothetical protein [Arthrobacter sp. EPSL27]|uniref:hypothetical protein n=1 Tax=Arthrobacter sp. EPSL27 TaxID=1745378 RepID=UPI0012F94044|nr:hypothetical protein [Arthrobacter sp. EPSL27]
MGNSGKIAIGAFLSALALLALTGITLHETVFLWFLTACAAAYVACVSEVVIRRRHRTLAASGIGSILFIAFGIAFLRQWGLAFNADPDAISAPVDSEHPDLFFYLAAGFGAATLLLLVAGTVLPARGRRPRGAGASPRRKPATGARRPASRPGTGRPAAPRPAASRAAVPRTAAPRTAAPRTAARPAARSAGGKPATTKAGTSKAGTAKPAGTAARSQPERSQPARPRPATTQSARTGTRR